MKSYLVKQGTTSKLINRLDPINPEITDWIVRDDVVFDSKIIDPILYHSDRSAYDDDTFIKMALQGYAIFANEKSDNYLLAVQHDQVSVV